MGNHRKQVKVVIIKIIQAKFEVLNSFSVKFVSKTYQV